MKKALIIGSSKGIGAAIKKDLKKLKIKIFAPSSKILDTSDIKSIVKYLNKIPHIDYLILNTGGPPSNDFFKIKLIDWKKFFNQLFLGFVIILQKIKINNDGFIFLISSHTIKNPEDKLSLSNSFRVALSSILKTVSNIYNTRNITCINIAPGPIKTKRLEQLVGKKNIKKFENSLPLKRAGKPEEISKFIFSVIKFKIKYINGTTIFFDGGLSKNFL